MADLSFDADFIFLSLVLVSLPSFDREAALSPADLPLPEDFDLEIRDLLLEYFEC
jgi:hypothetical protein